jgi:peptide/nickel transport system substrate-binding protein
LFGASGVIRRWVKRLDCFVALLLAMTVWVAPARAADPKDCGTIVLPANSDITSFNPMFASSIANAQAAELSFMGLIWVNRFQQIDWSRSLASAITTPDGGMTYDVTLRNWHWSDGVAVSSADVLYAFKLIKEMGQTYPGYGQGGMPDIIKSLTAIDATHFQVVLTRKVNSLWFVYDGLSQLEPLPAHDWGRYTLDKLWQLQSTPSFYHVVDGPMLPQRLDVGLDAVFVPNPEYEGPKPHFERFIFKFIQSDGAAVQQVVAGEIDMTGLPTELYESVLHLPGVHLEQLSPSEGWDYLAINFANPNVAFFKDVRVRQAIADAINQPELIKIVLHGFGSPVYAAVPPADTGMIAPAFQAGHYPVGYDPAKARALLMQAGYTPGPDGIMQKDGKKLSFVDLMTTGSAETVLMTEVMQAQLRDVGIDMRVREIEFNQLLALMNGPPTGWESGLLGMSVGGYPSGEGLFASNAVQNNNGYADKTMDALIDASINKPGLAGLYAYQAYTSAQQPEIFFPTPTDPVLVSDRLHGLNDFFDPAGQLAPEQLYCTAQGSPGT